MPYEHHEIHEGHSFHCWYMQTVSDIGDETIIAMRTPAGTTLVHMTAQFNAALASHARIMEGPAIVNNTGAPLTVFNRYRSSPNPSVVIDTSQNPNVADQATYFTEVTQGNVTGGTEITHYHLQAGTKKAVGGESHGLEWPLAPDTAYAFVIESLSDEDNVCIIRLNWYEHTG